MTASGWVGNWVRRDSRWVWDLMNSVELSKPMRRWRRQVDSAMSWTMRCSVSFWGRSSATISCLRASNLAGSSSGRMAFLAYMPCLVAFWLERCLPASEVGPVLDWALMRLALKTASDAVDMANMVPFALI